VGFPAAALPLDDVLPRTFVELPNRAAWRASRPDKEKISARRAPLESRVTSYPQGSRCFFSKQNAGFGFNKRAPTPRHRADGSRGSLLTPGLERRVSALKGLRFVGASVTH
jgi:hypothetical protein